MPLFPLHEPLVRFFSKNAHEHVPVAEVAELLGLTIDAVRALLNGEGGHENLETLSWPEAAAYLFDAWPLAQILRALGPEHASLVPAGFHPTRVRWQIPIFIVRAMEHQANAAGLARGVDDYVAGLLFNEIQPETLHAFRDDESFLSAYHYPARDQKP